MGHYTFRFRQGSRSSDVDVDFPDDDTAWDEAAAVCLPSLIPNEQQSLWTHSTQQDGSVITQLSLRFQATNMGDTTIHLSAIKLNRPCVRRKSIITKLLVTQHPTSNTHSSQFPVMPHARTQALANIMIKGAVGGTGRKRAMRVSVSILTRADGTSWCSHISETQRGDPRSPKRASPSSFPRPPS
jgi:hypothetical protein